MKKYIQNSFIKLKKIGERVMNASILSDTSWLLLTPDESSKIVYIFKSKDNELYQSFNGNVIKGKWEFIVDSDSLVMESEGQTELYNATLLANDFLFLKKDGDSKSLAFANFTKYKDWLKNEVFKKLKSLNAIEQTPINTHVEDIESNSPYKLLRKENLTESLDRIKPTLKGLKKADFFTAVEYTNNGMLNNNLADWETDEELRIKKIARFLNNEDAYKPIKQTYFINKKYPDYIEKLKIELAEYLTLTD